MVRPRVRMVRADFELFEVQAPGTVSCSNFMLSLCKLAPVYGMSLLAAERAFLHGASSKLPVILRKIRAIFCLLYVHFTSYTCEIPSDFGANLARLGGRSGLGEGAADERGDDQRDDSQQLQQDIERRT